MATYKDSGVDVEENNKANARIGEAIKKTHNTRIITKTGTFGGGLSLEDLKGMENPTLTGYLGSYNNHCNSLRELGNGIVMDAHMKSSGDPVAFLDYIAAAGLNALDYEKIVNGIVDALTIDEPVIPLAGGECAEMPGIFKQGTFEAVGALYCIAEGSGEEGFKDISKIEKSYTSDIDISQIKDHLKPALVFSMDGVGTKTMIGGGMRNMSGLVKDITHHSLNDILCQGAQGIGLMPYVGCYSIDDELIAQIEEGIIQCANSSDLQILNYIVNENPLIYEPGRYDICASVVGIIDTANLLTGNNIKEGDVVIGLASSGLHTNGYSLARKAVEMSGKQYTDTAEGLCGTIGDELLTPHKDYSGALIPLVHKDKAVKALAHITGGGMQDNIVRVLPEGLGADIDKGSWNIPPIFGLIQKWADVPEHDLECGGMYQTFNMGIGMAVVTSPDKARYVIGELKGSDETAYSIGKVVKNSGKKAYERVRFV